MLDVRLPLDRSIVALLASFVPMPFLAWWKGRGARGKERGGGGSGRKETQNLVFKSTWKLCEFIVKT